MHYKELTHLSTYKLRYVLWRQIMKEGWARNSFLAEQVRCLFNYVTYKQQKMLRKLPSQLSVKPVQNCFESSPCSSHLVGGSCPELPHFSPATSHHGRGYQGEGHQVEQSRLTHPCQQHHSERHYHSQQVGYREKDRQIQTQGEKTRLNKSLHSVQI